MQLDRKTVKTILGILCGSILFAWALMNHQLMLWLLGWIFSLLMPFLLGGALAFVISVPQSAIERVLFSAPGWKKRPTLARALSLLTTAIAMLLVLTGVFRVVIPELQSTVSILLEGMPAFFARLENWADQLAEWFPSLEEDLNALFHSGSSLPDLIDTARSLLANGTVGNILGSTVSIASGVVSGLVNFFVAVIFAIYLLLGREKLGVQFKKLLYAWCSETVAENTLHVARLSSRVFSSFISGQCLEAIILSVMFFVSMSLLRLPYALLVAVVIAITALIPVVGAFVGCFFGALLMLVQNPFQAVTFVILFLILQQVEGNLIYPRVVGSSIGLPAMWVLAAVTLGGGLFGIWGMLLMVPTASVLYALLRENTYRRLKAKSIPEEKLYLAPSPRCNGTPPAADHNKKTQTKAKK